ncbi:hypothetical protein P171DRAFT_482843 [Karstenula rhodostoma CBS 690.94]|uniref:Heterokaryon incompatibility domain-containing protein n=1 Tax=Karstenula rhodostoma CBS 690.94 TaxID=1392251 RepID=A0A9P4PP96_9PLEO|nr:hypothetical protein P171DRAFT_482843 [Karstenula rhodostoma CBS 690.94]
MASMALVQSWLEKAGVTHEVGVIKDKHQSELHEEILGCTVIDCKSQPFTLVPLPSGEQYVTLSYVWGAQGTEEEPVKNGKLPHKLPHTIKDSITNNEQVKSRLIAHMDRIYACSSLTLIACVGNGPQHGLTGVGRPRIMMPRIHGYQLVPSTREITSSVWASRGWTFQEAIFSRRQLYFTDRQLVFQSMDFVESELTAGSNVQFDSSSEHIFPFGEFLTESPENRFIKCLEEFSMRTLTYPDKYRLTALHGVFSPYESRGITCIKHLWGLPVVHTSYGRGLSIHFALCWYSVWHLKRQSHVGACYSAFPTWSWASCPGEVHFSRYRSPTSPKLDIEGIELSTGEVISWEEYNRRIFSSTQTIPQPSMFIHVTGQYTTPLYVRNYLSCPIYEYVFDVPRYSGELVSQQLSVDFHPVPPESALVCTDVLIAIHLSAPTDGDYRGPKVMVLREERDYWERIGMMFYNKKELSNWKMEPRKFRLG